MADALPERLIAHLDMDAFYASVELLRYPDLQGLPVVIGGGRRHQPQAQDEAQPEGPRRYARLRDYAGRGVITTATYAARALGVHSGMGLMKAAALAPDAVLLPVATISTRWPWRASRRAVAAPAQRAPTTTASNMGFPERQKGGAREGHGLRAIPVRHASALDEGRSTWVAVAFSRFW